MLALQRAAGNQAVGELMGTYFAQPDAEAPDVRIHAGPEADARTEAQHAAACTTGRDVYLSERVDLGTELGQRVLRHEFTHVVQQERARAGMPLASQATLEGEASAVSGIGAGRGFTGVGAATPGSVQKMTEAELEEEWRRLHPRKGPMRKQAAPGEVPIFDEEAWRADREAYKTWREKRVERAEKGPIRGPEAELDEQIEKDVAKVEKELNATFYTDTEAISQILWYWAQEPFQSKRVRGLYLDKLFRKLRNATKEKGLLAPRTTNYYNMLFEDRDLAEKVREIRDRFSVEFKGVEPSEISESTELAPLEQRSLPPTKNNLRKAKIVAQGLLGIPDEKQTQEERSLCLGIMRAGGIDRGGERFLLTQYHAVTAEERARYQRQAILSAVMTVIDYYSIVFALEAPIEMAAESAVGGAGLEELTSIEARSLELTGERELAAQARSMTPELEANIAKGTSLETQGEDVLPLEGTRNPESTGQGAHPEWEARRRSQKPLTEKKRGLEPSGKFEPKKPAKELTPEEASARTQRSKTKLEREGIETTIPKRMRGEKVVKARAASREAQLAGLTLDDSAARKLLNKNLGPAPGSTSEWQAHHLVPYELRTHPVVDKAALEAGWDINGARNGEYLPIDPKVEGAGNKAIHSQSHPQYNTMVRERLDKIQKLGGSPAEQRAALEDLSDELRRKLINGEIKLK
jgi:hypothetical protein